MLGLSQEEVAVGALRLLLTPNEGAVRDRHMASALRALGNRALVAGELEGSSATLDIRLGEQIKVQDRLGRPPLVTYQNGYGETASVSMDEDDQYPTCSASPIGMNATLAMAARDLGISFERISPKADRNLPYSN